MNSKFVIIAFLVTFLVGMAIGPPLVNAVTPKNTGMSILFYDADGNLVYNTEPESGLFGFEYQLNDGTTVDAMVLLAHYNIQGLEDGSTWTLDVDMVFNVMTNDAQHTSLNTGTVTKTVTSSQAGAQGDVYSDVFNLSETITRNQEGDTYGYIIKVTVTYTVEETLSDGTTRTTDATLSTSVLVTWNVNDFNVSGSLSLGPSNAN